MIKRTNGRRIGLLTEQEKTHIRGNKMNNKTLSKLYAKLNLRMEEIQNNFELIGKCKQLEAWRATNKSLLEGVANAYIFLSTIPQTVYTTPVNFQLRTIKEGRKTYKRRHYWLDRNLKQKLNVQSSEFITNRIFQPSYALRKIKRYVKNGNEIKTLEYAVEKNLLPTSKENALSIQELNAKRT